MASNAHNFGNKFCLKTAKIYVKKVVILVETATKEVPQSIAIKGYNSDSIASKKSKGNKSSFADFMKDLGKTTAQKSGESAMPNSAEMFKKVSDIGDSSASMEAKKTEILSNLLKGKSQEIKSEKAPQSPLDSILQRPKATHTKLNATPELKQPKESAEAQSGRFTNRDAVLRSLKGTNISFADSANDAPKFIKTAETSADSPKNSAIPSVSDLEKAGQNMAKNSANDADSQIATTKSNLTKDLPKDSPKISDSRPQSQNIATNQTANQTQNEMDSQSPQRAIDSLESPNAQDLQQSQPTKPSTAQTAILNDTPKIDNAQNKAPAIDSQGDKNQNAQQSTATSDSELPSTAQLLQDTPQIATQQNNAPNNTANQSSQNAPSQAQTTAQKPIDSGDSSDLVDSSDSSDLNEIAQNATKEPNADKTQSFAKLGIANTLKYGAFKAFDALSLLKPSDGKKLSELIKKADELSLNLQSVKYTKMAQTPLSANYFANQLAASAPKITEPNLAPNLAQSANQTAPKEVPNQKAQNDSALAQVLSELPSESQKTQENKGESPKNEAVATKNEIKNDSAKNDKNGDLPNNGKNLAQNSKDSSQNATQTLDSKSPDLKIEQQKTAESKAQENTKIPESKTIEPKIEQSKIEQPKTPEQTPKNDNPTTPPNSDLKPVSFKVGESKFQAPKVESAQTQSIEPTQNNIANAESTPKTEQLGSKLFDARETMRHFAHNLRSEIQNYKPPLTKITLELQPANLGSVEVSIISQGKNIQIQLNAPQNTLNLFIQNQSDLRTALSQIGYDNVAMSFSNGSQMGFSDNSGKWRYESNANKFRNNFGLKSLDDAQDENETFEIMITNNYA